MRDLSVLQVLPTLESGGVERGTLEIGRALVQAGHRSTVISNGGRLQAQLEAEGSRHITLPVHRKSLVSLRLVGRLRSILASQRFDVVHPRSRMPAWLVYLAWRKLSREARAHLVTTVHGLYTVNAYSAVMTKGERVIAVSETVRDYIVEHYPGASERIRVIYRGVDPAEFPLGYTPSQAWLEAWFREFPGLEGKELLVFPARLTRWKGHRAYLEMLARILNPDIHGVVVGDVAPNKRAYQRELQSRVGALGIEGRVTFTGYRSDVREVMSIASIVFNLSEHEEPFGRTMVEAMTMGVPVVAWDYGGATESLGSLFPRGLVTPQDMDALVVTVQEVLLRRLKPLPNERFLKETMTRETIALYRELVTPADAE